MPAGVFLCLQNAAGFPAQKPDKVPSFRHRKNTRVMGHDESSTQMPQPRKCSPRPQAFPPLPPLAAKLRRENRSSQRRSAPTAKTDKGSTLRSLPTANADTPLAGTSAPAGLLRKQMREPIPFTPAHALAAAQHHAGNAIRKAHPRFSLRKSRHRQHQKNFYNATLKPSIKVLS